MDEQVRVKNFFKTMTAAAAANNYTQQTNKNSPP